MKGISPLVASVLLIAFTIAIAGVILTWSSGFISSGLERSATMAECTNIMEVSSATFQNGIFSAVLRNTGNINLSDFVAVVSYSNASRTAEIPLKLYGIEEPLEPKKTDFMIVYGPIFDWRDERVKAYWKLNSNGTDYSSYENNGEMKNGVDCSVDGKYEKACKFDGTNDYLEVADSNSLDITDQITVEAWINIEGSGIRRIIDKRLSYNFYIRGDNRLQAEFWSGGVVIQPITHSTVLTPGWHHVAWTYNSNTPWSFRLFVDGVRNMANSNFKIDTSATKIGIGAQAPNPSTAYHFKGYIDEVIIWNRALDDITIRHHANPEKPLNVEIISGTCPANPVTVNVR